MAHNFQRPNLPYDAESLQNDKRYQLLTRSNNRPPTDVMLDTDVNYLIDAVRQLDTDIANIEAGVIQGSDNPENAGGLLTTDGDSNLAWIKIQDANVVDQSISASKLIPGTVTANEMMDGTITGGKIGQEEIAASNLGLSSVTTNKINDGAVTAPKLGASAVTTDKINDGAVTDPKLGTGAVTAPKLGASAVTTDKINDGAVTASKLGAGAATTDKINDGAVTAPKLGAAAVITDKINDGAVTAPKIASSVAATKSQQEAGAAANVFITPSVQQNHPSAAKAYVLFDGTNGNIVSQYGVSAVSRTGAGTYLITFSTAFADALYITSITTENFSAVRSGQVDPSFARTTTQVRIITISTAQTANDSSFVNCIFHGTQ